MGCSDKLLADEAYAAQDNLSGPYRFRNYQGKSWLHLLNDPQAAHHQSIFASHTFHEIQMYYPMRVVRDEQYKLIWNVAHPLPFPFASDLWSRKLAETISTREKTQSTDERRFKSICSAPSSSYTTSEAMPRNPRTWRVTGVRRDVGEVQEVARRGTRAARGSLGAQMGYE